MDMQTVWIGFDCREAAAFMVAKRSIERRLTKPINVNGLVLKDLQQKGLYTRPHTRKEGGQLWDIISDAPMSTEFACSRFLTPLLAKEGWALFMDCDMMIRRNLNTLFDDIADKKFAVMCVKHSHNPSALTKMDNQQQTKYARKNWSSVMLMNASHPKMQPPHLTLEMINTLPGRDLHRFCWLEDNEIGELPPEWNYLVGHTTLPEGVEPCIVHHTEGVPFMLGYEDAEYADEWWSEVISWAA
jgi:lipopolysaccharide biosynthesis glycosyltransferase